MNANRDGWGSGRVTRSLTPTQCAAVRDALADGVKPEQLAREYGVCRRTIYRYARLGRQTWQTVTVGDWHAEFVLTPEGPVRCTAWMANR